MIINTKSKNGVSIATALRGPDFERMVNFNGRIIRVEQILKYIFTARLRYIVGIRDEQMVLRHTAFDDEVNEYLGMLVHVAASFPTYTEYGCILHFLRHIRQAFQSLPRRKRTRETELLGYIAGDLSAYIAYGSPSARISMACLIRQLAEVSK